MHEKSKLIESVVGESIGNVMNDQPSNYQQVAQIPLNESTAALVSALYSLLSNNQTSSTTQKPPPPPQPQVTPADPPNTKIMPSNEVLQLDIPSHVKSINLTNNSQTLNELTRQIEILHKKVDLLLKHSNLTFVDETNVTTVTGTENTNGTEMHFQQENNTPNEDNSTPAPPSSEQDEAIILEGYPPSYSIVQAVKEQQQQEYYALTLSSRHAQQLLKTEPTQVINVTPSELKNLQKGKNVDFWVPSQHYLSDIAACTEVEQNVHVTSAPTTQQTPTLTAMEASQTDEKLSSALLIPSNSIEKIFVESRSRANFAKNLAFAIFTPEERRGKNCTGRVFGKAQRKGQLDQTKLQIVKEITFRKYPCSPQLLDITWRKECITAIDSGLRNEHRSSRTVLSSNSINPTVKSSPPSKTADTEINEPPKIEFIDPGDGTNTPLKS